MAKTFNKKEFRRWLDTLCSVVVKTRDDFTCQRCGRQPTNPFNIQWCHVKSKKSNGYRWSLFNTLTLCGHCHAKGHDHIDEFSVWFAAKFPERDKINKQPYKSRTWREEDFRVVERALLEKAADLDVDYMKVPKRYRVRFSRKIQPFLKPVPLLF